MNRDRTAKAVLMRLAETHNWEMMAGDRHNDPEQGSWMSVMNENRFAHLWFGPKGTLQAAHMGYVDLHGRTQYKDIKPVGKFDQVSTYILTGKVSE